MLALCDGENAIPLAPARDFKRIGEGDSGPNTGGMGAYSPVDGATPELIEDVRVRILQPVVDELKRRGTPFHGVLYAGLMLTDDGPSTLEFNVRFGDPETQVVLPRLKSDLLDLFMRATTPGGLAGVELEWDERACVTVVLASRGYPATSSSRRRDQRARGRRRRGHPRRNGPGKRQHRHRGRPRAERHGAGQGPRSRQGGRICCGGQDRLPWQDLQTRHSRMTEPTTQTDVDAELEGLEVDAPLVGIVMGSKSDMPVMEKAAKELTDRGIRNEIRVMSAHRDPDLVAEYAKNARMRGLKVIIAGAGLAAALPGVVAAHTDLPVIGVPLTSSMTVAGGLDALLSIAQMPPGVPVATVGVDNPKNAAALAARILSL